MQRKIIAILLKNDENKEYEIKTKIAIV